MCALGCFKEKFAKWILVVWAEKFRWDYWSGRSGEEITIPAYFEIL